MQLTFPALEKLSLNKVFEGEATHFNPACVQMIDRIVGPVVGEEVIDVTSEVNCEGRRLDLLAVTREHIVAIELQFNGADASHLGRLIGWYAPAVDATASILVAESFPELLVKQVRDKAIKSLALVQATAGWNKDGQVGLDFNIIASSLDIDRQTSSNANEANENNIKSIQLLSNELSKYGLKDSNAKYYIRLFPVKDHVWVTCEIRSTRVVLTVGAATTVHPEEIVDSLRDGWVRIRNRLYLTIFDEGSNYEITETHSKSIAKIIADMRSELENIVDQLIETIPDEATIDPEGEQSSIDT